MDTALLLNLRHFVYHCVYSHCNWKGFILPFFLFAFFVCFFSHDSLVRFTVIGICSHNREDVKSASGELMPEISCPILWMQCSKGTFIFSKTTFWCVCEREKWSTFANHAQFCVRGVSGVWCEFVLWDTLSGLAPNKSFLSTQQNLYEQKEFNNKCGKCNCFTYRNR